MNADTLYVGAYIAAAVISLSVGVAAWRRRPAPGSLGLAVLSFAQAEWSSAFALQWILTDRGPSLVWLAVRTAGLFITPVAILMLVAGYIGAESWLTRRRLVALMIIPTLCYVAVLTEPLHGLYLAGVAPTMKFATGGPLFFVNVFYSYGLILTAVGLLVLNLRRRKPYLQQAIVLLAALLLPVVHFAAQLAGFDLLPRVNSVPYTFTVSGALMWFALTRLGLFRLVPIARDQLIEQLPVGIIVLDADRRVVDTNPAALRMTGAAGPVLGQTSDEAFPLQLETVHQLREALLTATTASTEAELSTGLWVEATASILKDRTGEEMAVLVTLTDVSAQHAAERMQRDFVANVAHELQTPLTGLSLLARTIPRALQDDPQMARRFVDRLGTEVERLVHITDELMALSLAESRPHDRPTEPADVRDVVDRQVATIGAVASEEGTSLTISVPSGLRVACDAHDLTTIIGNLLQNAVRYTEPGGRIVVSAQDSTDARGRAWVEVMVADDGIGIPPEDQERIFERFYRVDKARSRRTGGSGLGLSIVKQTTERRGGAVSLVSAPGEGSTFTVRLPRA